MDFQREMKRKIEDTVCVCELKIPGQRDLSNFETKLHNSTNCRVGDI